jgi:hypothetical protein
MKFIGYTFQPSLPPWCHAIVSLPPPSGNKPPAPCWQSGGTASYHPGIIFATVRGMEAG